MSAKTTSAASTYKYVMGVVTAGNPVDRKLFDEAVAYAKTSKRRVPKTENFVAVETTHATEAAINKALALGAKAVKVEAREAKAAAVAEKKAERTAAKEAKAAEKAVVAAVKESAKLLKSLESKDCKEDGCDTVAYAKGLCSKHYTSTRRQDPTEKAKANEASRTYRARIAAEALAALEALKATEALKDTTSFV